MSNLKIECVALIIPPEKTLAEAYDMLSKIFDGKNSASIYQPDLDKIGYRFTVEYYAKDRKHIFKIIRDSGFLLDYDEMSDWEVEE